MSMSTRREDWGAVAPKGQGEPLEGRLTKVVVTYSTGTEACYSWSHCKQLVKEMQRKAIEKGLVDIPYNFLVGGDGEMYEGRGWDVRSDTSLPYPEFDGMKLDIAFIGEWKINDPPRSMCDLCSYFINHGVTRKSIAKDYELLLVRGKQMGYVY